MDKPTISNTVKKNIMPSCAKCWGLAYIRAYNDPQKDQSGHYQDLLGEHSCTPEKQAGPSATKCHKCNRITVHPYAKRCMACGTEKIITEYSAKPMPIRYHDWQAFFDGYDKGDPVGNGATEKDAIADLLEKWEAGND